VNLNILFEAKKIEIMRNPDKYQNDVISFVNDEASPRKTFHSLDTLENEEFVNEIGNYKINRSEVYKNNKKEGDFIL
jgi:hypothetical protein